MRKTTALLSALLLAAVYVLRSQAQSPSASPSPTKPISTPPMVMTIPIWKIPEIMVTKSSGTQPPGPPLPKPTGKIAPYTPWPAPPRLPFPPRRPVPSKTPVTPPT